mgnify:CR=1 FL=1|tara:strand:- start:1091 stop:1327 length:237 start_codon:yes stop_codon:yes gene_type:complete
MKKYGRTKEEIDASKTIQCREIVKEILDFGVDDYQKLKIIELLGLELESRDQLKSITSVAKRYLNTKEEQNKKILSID